ncbi:MAG: M20 metallopeptidase family protein [Persicimonas sp.]
MARLMDSEKIFPHMVEVRRAIHEHPELAFEEVETARRIIEELERLGLPYEYGGEGSAVIGRLQVDEDLPTVALRAEMDALAGEESTGLPFSSKVEGVVHACGHDAHMAMVLGAAEMLVGDRPPGNVVFVFQPAEERGGGARVALKSDQMNDVEAVFAGHVTRKNHVGEITVGDDVITAQSDGFSIHVKGRGGHGARPHEGIDAVIIAGSLINAVQTLVSRELNPVYPSVITIGHIEAGTAANVIAERAVLEGSIRTTHPRIRKHVHRGLERMAAALSELHGAQIDVEIRPGYPPVVNTPRETDMARRAARRIVGQDCLRQMEHPSMGSEDFAYFLEEFPGAYVRFGARQKGEDHIALHSPSFTVDESVLKVGAAYFDEVSREALRELAPGSERE